jgi:hypothetical protein
LRRLDAEVLIDAICQVTGTTESYSSLIPEPWTFIPHDQRSICLADASITSPFLELFGRPARSTGLQSERTSDPTTSQKLHLLNSRHVLEKIDARFTSASGGASRRSRGSRQRFQDSSRSSPTNVREIYLTVLSRYPSEDELALVEKHARETDRQGADLLIDLTWALINTPEFLYRH